MTNTICICLDTKTKDKIDEYATKRAMNRSVAIRQILNEFFMGAKI